MYNHNNTIRLINVHSKAIKKFAGVNWIACEGKEMSFTTVNDAEVFTFQLCDWSFDFQSQDLVPTSLDGNVIKANRIMWSSTIGDITTDKYELCTDELIFDMTLFDKIHVKKMTNEVGYEDEYGNPYRFCGRCSDKWMYIDNTNIFWLQEGEEVDDFITLVPYQY